MFFGNIKKNNTSTSVTPQLNSFSVGRYNLYKNVMNNGMRSLLESTHQGETALSRGCSNATA